MKTSYSSLPISKMKDGIYHRGDAQQTHMKFARSILDIVQELLFKIAKSPHLGSEHELFVKILLIDLTNTYFFQAALFEHYVGVIEAVADFDEDSDLQNNMVKVVNGTHHRTKVDDVLRVMVDFFKDADLPLPNLNSRFEGDVKLCLTDWKAEPVQPSRLRWISKKNDELEMLRKDIATNQAKKGHTFWFILAQWIISTIVTPLLLLYYGISKE
mmetsp:Transcript_37525/g.42331  ORF Transcript_37525/g.42331 Transcript_37525/m.42331 type:complete len:214 (+) Transcript_37525:86-727(+)